MRFRSLLREPLIHFFALGALLFLYFEWSGGRAGPGSNRIVLTAGRIEHLAAGFTRTWKRPPTEEELKGLVDDYVREEIATREAREMGLDRDDTIIRRRLRQKMEFLVEDALEVAPPTDEELEEWLRTHPEDFRSEPRLAFRQVYVSPARGGASAASEAGALLARLEAEGPEAGIESLGDPIMLPQEVGLESQRGIGRTFGPDFASSLLEVETGRWTGPIESGFGLHLVFVRERVEAALPDLAAVRPALERELVAERRRVQLDAMYQRLLEKYIVVVERPKDARGIDAPEVRGGASAP